MKRILILILALFVISSCEKPVQEIVRGEIIDLEILYPSEGYTLPEDMRELQVETKVRNNGDSLAAGSVCITGLDEDIFSGYTFCSCESFSVDEDGEETVSFSPYSIIRDEQEEQTIAARLQTDHEVYSTFEALLKNEYYLGQVKNLRSDRAPFAVGSISEKITRLKQRDELILEFYITLSHKGQGHLWDRNMIGDCSSTNIIRKIEVELLDAPEEATCEQKEFKTLDDYDKAMDEGIKIRCTVRNVEPPEIEYYHRMTLKLNYAYEIRKAHNFKL